MWQHINTRGKQLNITFTTKQDEIKFGNICYRSAEKFLSCHLSSKNIKHKIHQSEILSSVLYG
jgi:hypothetical protein